MCVCFLKKMWEEAAAQGHAGSELQLGQAYFTGSGVETGQFSMEES